MTSAISASTISCFKYIILDSVSVLLESSGIFTVTEAGNYIISFTTEGDQELLLLHCVIQASVPTSITLRTMDDTQSVQIYNLSGVKMDGLKPGLNIIRTPDGKTKKVMIK